MICNRNCYLTLLLLQRESESALPLGNSCLAQLPSTRTSFKELTYVIEDDDLGTDIELSHRAELRKSHTKGCLSRTC